MEMTPDRGLEPASRPRGTYSYQMHNENLYIQHNKKELMEESKLDSHNNEVRMEDRKANPRPSLSNMPSLFYGKSPFGPPEFSFGESSESIAVNKANWKGDDFSMDTFESRVPSFLRSLDLLSDLKANEFSADDCFMGNSDYDSNHLSSGRRHSIAVSESLNNIEPFASNSISFHRTVHNPKGSTLSPAAPSFHSGSLMEFLPSFDTTDSDMISYSPHTPMSAINEISFRLSSYKGPLYAVEFKAGRTEIFFILEIDGKPQLQVNSGDLVIVEADRGEDLGKVTAEISLAKLKQLMTTGELSRSVNDSFEGIAEMSPELAALINSKEVIPKRIHRLALSSDLKLLQAKAQEEAIAMVRCQSRIRQKKLSMEVVDAEYQWDRNKLTFYFWADGRVDFRELVRDLFRIYKTRIWMCAVDQVSTNSNDICNNLLDDRNNSGISQDFKSGTYIAATSINQFGRS